MAVADAGVDRGGDVADASQVAAGDRAGQDLDGVQDRDFGSVQGPVQPPLPVAFLRIGPGGERGPEQGAVALPAGRCGLGVPDRVQDGEVVGVG